MISDGLKNQTQGPVSTEAEQNPKISGGVEQDCQL